MRAVTARQLVKLVELDGDAGRHHEYVVVVRRFGGGLECRLNPDNRQLREFFAQRCGGSACGGVAGDDDGLCAGFHHRAHQLARTLAHPFGRLVTIGGVCRVAEIYESLVRHFFYKALEHAYAAHAGVEDAYVSFFEHAAIILQCRLKPRHLALHMEALCACASTPAVCIVSRTRQVRCVRRLRFSSVSRTWRAHCVRYHGRMDAYQTIAGPAQGEYEEKKSRFIASVDHVTSEEEALAHLARIRAENPMARHNVYAYVLRAGNRVRYSDDGEPQKTAGLPVLSVIQHQDLSDVICVVTRYFGGTLLGTGGLVRAYTRATQEAFAAARIVHFALCRDLVACVPYPLYEKTARFLKDQGIQVLSSDFAADVTLELRVRAEEVEVLERSLIDLTGGQIEVIAGDAAFRPLEAK